MKKQIKPARPAYPSPAGLITSVRADGTPNIIPLGEIFNLSISSPVTVGLSIAPERFSHKLISECGEFVVNFPTIDLVEKVDICGSMSGRDGTDKFAEAGLTPLEASIVRPPLIAECPMNLECKLLRIDKNIGDHDLFIGEVVAEHVDEGCLTDEGQIITEKLNGFALVQSDYYTLGKKIGWHGFTRK